MKAIYPGSFDPITLGHLDIIERSSKMFDEVVVAILANSAKRPLFSVEERVEMTGELLKEYDNISVDCFDGLLINYAKSIDANIIIRGLRAVTDFEYELQIAQTNRVQSGKLDTVFLVTSLQYSFLSSTIVKEFASYGSDITNFVPAAIIPYIEDKYK